MAFKPNYKKPSTTYSEPKQKADRKEVKKENIEVDEARIQNNNVSGNKKLQELLKLDENSILQGVILSEVLGRPKARRERRKFVNYNISNEE